MTQYLGLMFRSPFDDELHNFVKLAVDTSKENLCDKSKVVRECIRLVKEHKLIEVKDEV